MQQTNITLFENCHEIQEVEVELLSVRYEYVDDICSTVHGMYEIYAKRMNMDYEVVTTRTFNRQPFPIA